MSSVGVSLLKAGVELRSRLHSEYVLYGAELHTLRKKYVWKLLDRGEPQRMMFIWVRLHHLFLALRRVGGYKITLGRVSNNRLFTRHMPCVTKAANPHYRPWLA